MVNGDPGGYNCQRVAPARPGTSPNMQTLAARLPRPVALGFLFAVLTMAGLLVHGYHYGIEDQAIYLPGIKQAIDPSLYGHDSVFFQPQTQPTLITKLVAVSATSTGLQTDTVVFAWQLLSIYAFLLGCWMVASRIFPSDRARLGSLAMITVLFTLPVAGTALYLVDQYLHPRALASALILIAAALIMPTASSSDKSANRRPGVTRVLGAILLVLCASMLHIMMAFFGVMLITLLLLPPLAGPVRRPATSLAMLGLPFVAFFQPSSAGWAEAARTRSQHYMMRWEWYELLGVVAPIFVLWGLARFAERKQMPELRSLCVRTIWLAVLGLTGGLIITLPSSLERLTPFQPLRSFHLVYIMMILVAGGLLGEYVLQGKAWRWMLLFLPICCGMYFVQRELFEFSAHVEWPGTKSANAWVEAYDWVRVNTPKDAYFALDPRYINFPGDDSHGFRGLAERSELADWGKDPGVISLFPNAAGRWHDEVHALDGWETFGSSDFRRLKQRFGVDWMIVALPVGKHPSPAQPANCAYRNEAVCVFKIQ